MNSLITILHNENLSCVLRNGDETRRFNRRGILDLFHLYIDDPAFLKGAMVADKVIGKGAASILALGGVAQVYADTISTTAMEVLINARITVTAKTIVPNIMNRDNTGFCPLETRCKDENDLNKIFPIIIDFVSQLKK